MSVCLHLMLLPGLRCMCYVHAPDNISRATCMYSNVHVPDDSFRAIYFDIYAPDALVLCV